MAGLIQVGANGAGLTLVFIFIAIYKFPVIRFIDKVSWPLISIIIFMPGLNYAFECWLRAPTLAGRRLLDRIDGFRHYLAVAEEEEIALTGAPAFTTDLYEAYLPYATALDLEHEWTAKLDRAIASGLVDRGYRQPRWYHSNSHGGMHFSNVLRAR
ncbi:MAG: DUF2207 domain-containing protein [Gammaproteobacteria bacterium]|nr:DUF2207 domain-containing protein [Gammaproteobacteria bacterium]MDH3534970.1 DUF2207 domain-containing protein [Gammaproteobacteria bacterium]